MSLSREIVAQLLKDREYWASAGDGMRGPVVNFDVEEMYEIVEAIVSTYKPPPSGVK